MIFRCKVYLHPTATLFRRSVMVDKMLRKGETVYACELCGFGYKELETAELCEEYCATHGSYSPEIHKQATCKPNVRVMQLTA